MINSNKSMDQQQSNSDNLSEDNRPEMISSTEKMYFLLEHNITQEAKNVFAQFISLVKTEYPKSNSKKEWNMLLDQMQSAINNFENKLSDEGEMQFYGIYHNALHLTTKSHVNQ